MKSNQSTLRVLDGPKGGAFIFDEIIIEPDQRAS
jgi:hypothetical protein